jgi:hypothetical protein
MPEQIFRHNYKSHRFTQNTGIFIFILFLYRFKCGWIAENTIWQGHTEGVFELK